MMTITLYDSRVSPNARKVRLLAAELDIPLTRVALDPQKGEFRSPEYLAKNPNGKVPMIEDDGFVLWESAAILKYLAANQPERGLVPSSLKEQAQVDQWLFWWTAHPESALSRLTYERRIKPFLGQPGNDPSIVAEAEAALDRFLPILDAQLAGKENILGKLSVVDFAVGPWLEIAPTFLEVDLVDYPNLITWLKRMQAKSYWKDA
jgi:glutathione S-transferase